MTTNLSIAIKFGFRWFDMQSVIANHTLYKPLNGLFLLVAVGQYGHVCVGCNKATD